MAETRYQHLWADDGCNALEVAERSSNHRAHLLEKHIWVAGAFSALFDGPFAQRLTFKGWHFAGEGVVRCAIRRLSEDGMVLGSAARRYASAFS